MNDRDAQFAMAIDCIRGGAEDWVKDDDKQAMQTALAMVDYVTNEWSRTAAALQGIIIAHRMYARSQGDDAVELNAQFVEAFRQAWEANRHPTPAAFRRVWDDDGVPSLEDLASAAAWLLHSYNLICAG